MKTQTKHKGRFIISGGGTGGHIFPAIAIAEAIKQKMPDAAILFVGAVGRMEMEKIPLAGYDIVGLEVMGLERKFTLKNFSILFKMIKSFFKARKIIKDFQPDACIGVGGYVSASVLFVASMMGIKSFIQEQNSYPGITNKILSKFASKIFVAYDNLADFFPKDKLVLTGNPVRQDICGVLPDKNAALDFFGLNQTKKTILIIGGSLGARTINNAIEQHLDVYTQAGYQLLWQTGKGYYDGIIERTKNKDLNAVHIHQFIKEMNYAYAAADVIISRAGALSISELCIVGKPCILIPSPNVTEDHQTKNAMALVNKQAALLITDKEADEKLANAVLNLLNNKNEQEQLGVNLKQLAKTNAAEDIVNKIFKEINDER